MSIRPQVPVTVSDELEELLTPELRVMLDKLAELALDTGADCGVPVLQIEYAPLYDPEGDGITITCAIQVGVPEEPAFKYWEHLSLAEEEWARTLPLAQQRAYFGAFGTHVYWIINEPAV